MHHKDRDIEYQILKYTVVRKSGVQIMTAYKLDIDASYI